MDSYRNKANPTEKDSWIKYVLYYVFVFIPFIVCVPTILFIIGFVFSGRDTYR